MNISATQSGLSLRGDRKEWEVLRELLIAGAKSLGFTKSDDLPDKYRSPVKSVVRGIRAVETIQGITEMEDLIGGRREVSFVLAPDVPEESEDLEPDTSEEDLSEAVDSTPWETERAFADDGVTPYELSVQKIHDEADREAGVL